MLYFIAVSTPSDEIVARLKTQDIKKILINNTNVDCSFYCDE